MSKRLELIFGTIAVGLILNAAVGLYHIVQPEEATAQAAVTDVNLVQLRGKPIDAYEWSDGTVSQRIIIDRAVGGGESSPLYVKMAP